MANLLVIGGTGFFGKSILDAFQRGLLKAWEIKSVDVVARNADHLKYSAPHLITDQIRLHNLDITSCNSLPNANYVIHAAASTNANDYLMQPKEEKRNIQAGTYNYCRLALKYHQDSKIVFCSSGAVYGQQPDDVDFLLENSALAPIETLADNKKDYAAAKRDAESAFIELGAKGLNISIARCFAFVGPFLPRDQHFAIGNFIEDGLNNRPIVVRANRQVYRSYMYSDDLVTWLMTLASASTPLAERFNVGSDNAVSIKNLAHHVGSYFTVPVSIAEVTNQLADKYVPSIQKARQQLGLTLEFGLAEAIDQTVKIIRNMAND